MAILAALTLALASCSSATTLPRVGSRGGFVSFPIKRTTTTGPVGLGRRDNTVTLYNASQTTYLFELEIGTPQQKVDVVLDTGSFELWVDPSCSTAGSQEQIALCKKAGTYVPSKSSTVVDQDVTNNLTYGIGSVDIKYVTDHISIPGTNNTIMKDVIFGLGDGSLDLSYGIAGIGHGYNFNTDYPNLVDELALNNMTNGRYFSVALASKDASNGGVIIFGGVDTKKFSGPLYKYSNLPPQIENGRKGPWRYWAQMDSFGVTRPSDTNITFTDSSMPVVLDTGSTLSYLPKSIITQLGATMGATTAIDGSLSVPCSLTTQGGTADFKFGDLTLRVPYHEFIWEIAPGLCYASVAPSDPGTFALLGDSFLRSAYVVMDQDNQAIYLAQYTNCGKSEKTFDPTANYTGECTYQPQQQNAGSYSLATPAYLWCIGAFAFGFQVFMALF